jgi:hypothetical protein
VQNFVLRELKIWKIDFFGGVKVQKKIFFEDAYPILLLLFFSQTIITIPPRIH